MTANVRNENMFETGKNRLLDIDSDINGITKELRLMRPARAAAAFYEQLAQVKTQVSETYKWLQQAEHDDGGYGLAGHPAVRAVEERLNSVWEQYIQLVNRFTDEYM
jgi:hypothetical protein